MNFKNIIKKSPDFSHILLSLAYVLGIYQHNIGELYFSKVIVPLLIITAVAVLSRYIFSLFFGNRERLNIAAVVFLFLFFSYGQVAHFFRNFYFFLRGRYFGVDYIIFPVWLLILFYLILIIKKSKKSLSGLNNVLSKFAAISLLIPISGILYFQVTQRINNKVKSPLLIPKLNINTKNSSLPDIYYIVPDSYSSEANFAKYFSYDNSKFVKSLEDKGFYVASLATSNYPTTLLSLASTFNMEYIDYLSRFTNSKDQAIGKVLIENNNALRLLKTAGYKYYQIGSWWWPTANNVFADHNYNIQKQNYQFLSGFTYTVIDATMLHPFLKKILPVTVIGESDEDKRNIIQYQFGLFSEVSKLKGPKFVFAHIIAPHAPYVFDKNCNFIDRQTTSIKSEEENYAEQTNCINQKLSIAVENILESANKPPIIIIQADEGAKFISARIKPANSWQDASDKLLQMKFPILAAYYFPGVDKKVFNQNLTPVNAFRRIFNSYFQTNLPLLPDKNYINLDDNHLYDFREVTNKLKQM